MFDFLFYREESPLIFTQAIFWGFFGVAMLCYQFIYKNISVRNVYLMGISMYFYYLTGGYFFTLLIFSTLVDYYIGKWIFASDNETKRKLLVTASVVINLGVLGYFKYAYFFVDSINSLFDTHFTVTNYLAVWTNALATTTFDINSIILPVGISFYTFQTISYSVDIYRRQVHPVRNIWDFAFYVSFFPQLVAGPIVRASDFVPQIYQPYKVSEVEYGKAIYLIVCGLFKKIFISDYISINFVDRVFASPLNYSGFENLMGVYGYAIQIYCDFSGYTDIAIGLSLLMGFRLNINFNSPYKAQNITDFWRRWHISLSSWLRDYLYISLGGNRKGKFRTYLNLLITMLLGGLWHGAHIRFIIWGALHGLALAVHKAYMEAFPQQTTSLGGKILNGVITFHFVCFCWIFFRAADMQIVGNILSQIGTNFGFEYIDLNVIEYYKIFIVIMIGFVVHLLPSDYKNQLSDTFVKLPDLTKAIMIVGIMLLLYQVKTSELQPFIYFQF
ncbi:MAG: MBOAT family protein [Thermoflexibacter sp.]|jgi:D-alanyl-lipoteichoic acid acyltransferase DltB (MBOAT superfamily)|nr:MBOAT family protein [Thermoflexibacter sp.]